jgi:hypothetical protein
VVKLWHFDEIRIPDDLLPVDVKVRKNAFILQGINKNYIRKQQVLLI